MRTTTSTPLCRPTYLPQGLSIEQQDGEYQFVPTSRLGSDHIISSAMLSSGAIRVIISSQSLKKFSGNNGALVTFSITASSSIDEQMMIEVKNVLASEVGEIQHSLPNAICHVTGDLMVYATGISLNKNSLLLAPSDSETLVATVTPSDVTIGSVTWSSSNTAIATVSSTGKVTAKAAGSAVITAKTTDGTNLSDSCQVTVLAPSSNFDFIADGLVYKINSDNETVTITYTDNSDTYAHNYPGLVTANIPMTVTHGGVTYTVVGIDQHAFRNCKTLESVTIPATVTSIGTYAFAGCEALESMVVKAGNAVYDSRNSCNAIIEKASNRLIAGCKTTEIPNTVTTIGTFAFYEHHGLETIEIPSSVTKIERSAFNHILGLKRIVVPNSVVTLEPYVFSQCYGLEEVTIGSGVTSMGQGLLYGCSAVTSLTSCIMNPNTVTMGTNVFKNMDYDNCVLHVPFGSSGLYRNADQWDQFFNIVEEEGVPGDVNGDAWLPPPTSLQSTTTC